ncbi:MAG: hypothetical protein AAGA12_02905 [Pseudomonadota bacterium]
MSDSVPSKDMEVVLQSIRRLVSDTPQRDAAPATSIAFEHKEPGGKPTLVLTSDQRIPSEQPTDWLDEIQVSADQAERGLERYAPADAADDEVPPSEDAEGVIAFQSDQKRQSGDAHSELKFSLPKSRLNLTSAMEVEAGQKQADSEDGQPGEMPPEASASRLAQHAELPETPDDIFAKADPGETWAVSPPDEEYYEDVIEADATPTESENWVVDAAEPETAQIFAFGTDRQGIVPAKTEHDSAGTQEDLNALIKDDLKAFDTSDLSAGTQQDPEHAEDFETEDSIAAFPISDDTDEPTLTDATDFEVGSDQGDHLDAGKEAQPLGSVVADGPDVDGDSLSLALDAVLGAQKTQLEDPWISDAPLASDDEPLEDDVSLESEPSDIPQVLRLEPEQSVAQDLDAPEAETVEDTAVTDALVTSDREQEENGEDAQIPQEDDTSYADEEAQDEGPTDEEDRDDLSLFPAPQAPSEELGAVSELTGAPDQAQLRALVVKAVREELAGETGSHITRNLRLLVRREVHRILASRDFD